MATIDSTFLYQPAAVPGELECKLHLLERSRLSLSRAMVAIFGPHFLHPATRGP